MRDVLDYLEERKEEFERHLSIARMLEERVNDLTQEGDVHVEVRHVNTIKSGLLIHLYNIVEAITTRTLEVVGETVVQEQPGQWKQIVLNEWVRAKVWSSEEKIGNTALAHLTRISGDLAAGRTLEAFKIKGEPGSWNDQSIIKLAKRLECRLVFPRNVKKAACERVYLNDTSALQYLAQRRNAIAHGASTFEDGARNQTLDELESLAHRVLPFLKAVTESYAAYLENQDFLLGEVAPT